MRRESAGNPARNDERRMGMSLKKKPAEEICMTSFELQVFEEQLAALNAEYAEAASMCVRDSRVLPRICRTSDSAAPRREWTRPFLTAVRAISYRRNA